MKHILIIGCNASGKTTMARKLSEKLNLPLIHLDKLYWRDNWTHATDEEFDKLLEEELKKDEWIIEGNIKRTLPKRLKYCDTVIYLDFSSFVCVLNAIKRLIQSHNKSRPDMGGECIEKFNLKGLKFINSIWSFNTKNRKDYYKMISQENQIKVIILKNRKQVNEYLKNINEVKVNIC